MRLLVLAALAALASLAAASAMAEGAKPLQPRDLFALNFATDPQVRPDGNAVAYVRNTGDIMLDRTRASIWLVDLGNGTQTPLVADDRSNIAPRWSPDGRRLAYVAAGPGGPPQLYVMWLDSGKSARVATLEQAPRSITWSPDGKTLALTMLVASEPEKLGSAPGKPEGATWADPLKLITQLTYRADGEGYLRPGFSHIFLVSADGGQPRQVTFGAFNDDGPLSWTPDGGQILFTANHAANWEHDPQESEVFALDVASGAATVLTHRVGPDEAPAVSPDGKLIAYVGYDDHGRGYENQRLYVMNRDGSGSRLLTGELDRSVAQPRWSADGKSVYVQYADRGLVRVARVGLDGKLENVAAGMGGGDLDRPYSGGDYSVGGAGVVAFTQGAADEPPELAVARRGVTTRLTALNADLVGARTLAKVEPMAVTSAFDKQAIDAWIVTPPNFDPAKKYPLILEIHGGPFSSYGPIFSTDDQLYAAAGYVVVYANPRGSTSYGEAFANTIDKAYPGHDYDDLMSVVDAAVAKGFVDEHRLYVTGGSGGGALTAWIVGKTHRFAAAATQKPVIDWTSEVLTVDMYSFMARYWFGKMPWEDPQAYWARSPLSLVGNVTTPTLVVVGEQDFRTPGSEAEQYYQALQLRGVPTALIKVPGAGHHGLATRPSQSAAKASAIIAWFERYRGGT
jgi:dipeptidyl aminopeptidase/acylaminoacyl peptidase